MKINFRYITEQLSLKPGSFHIWGCNGYYKDSTFIPYRLFINSLIKLSQFNPDEILLIYTLHDEPEDIFVANIKTGTIFIPAYESTESQ